MTDFNTDIKDDFNKRKENIASSFTQVNTTIEKGKKAQIGEKRIWGGQEYVKHPDGWVMIKKKGGGTLVDSQTGKKHDKHSDEIHGKFADQYRASVVETEPKITKPTTVETEDSFKQAFSKIEESKASFTKKVKELKDISEKDIASQLDKLDKLISVLDINKVPHKEGLRDQVKWAKESLQGSLDFSIDRVNESLNKLDHYLKFVKQIE